MRFDGFGPSGPGTPALPGRRRPAPVPARLTEQRDFGANPGDLRMFLYAPPRLAPGAPLVVILHGCGQSAAAYDEGTGWSSLADRFGFALLAPEQKTANNPSGCFNWFQPEDHVRGQGEAASIAQMIVHAVATRKLDARRVFVTGLSAGGAMAGTMLAAYPEIFAGGAIIAGLPYGAAANVYEALSSMRHVPDRPADVWGDAVRNASGHRGRWPVVSVWHGDADMIVNAGNGEAIVAQWADVHGLSGAPQMEAIGGQQRLVWHDADGKPVVEHYLLRGLGHGVPIATAGRQAPGKPGPFILEAAISSTLRIADFWGLARKPVAAPKKIPTVIGTDPPPAAPSPMMEPRMDNAPPSRVAAFTGNRVRRIIDRALTVAGLIKP